MIATREQLLERCLAEQRRADRHKAHAWRLGRRLRQAEEELARANARLEELECEVAAMYATTDATREPF
jgi:hypothetical protein